MTMNTSLDLESESRSLQTKPDFHAEGMYIESSIAQQQHRRADDPSDPEFKA